MSAAGLLGRALLGGVQGAAATAYEVGKEKRKKESELELIDLKDQKARALEQMRLDNNMKVSEFEATQRAEQARLDRQSRERIAGMQKSSGKPYLDPLVEARLNAVNSEIEAINGREMLEPADRTRLAQLTQMRDQMLGFAMAAPGAAGGEAKPSLADILGEGQGEATQKAKPTTLMEQYKASKASKPTEAPQDNTAEFNAQLDVIERQADWVASSPLSGNLGGLLSSGTGIQKQEYIRKLEAIYANGTPEQKQRAQAIFQRLMRE
jgi:hypothetical protein